MFRSRLGPSRKWAPTDAGEVAVTGQAALGTKSATETIHEALAAVVAGQGRGRLFRRLRTLEGLDIADEEVMRRAWR